MDRRGLTIVELVSTMIIGLILVMIIACQFAAEQRMRITIVNGLSTLQDAEFAMRHLTRTLRFALPNNVTITTTNTTFPYMINTTIQANHLENTVDLNITYRFSSANRTIEYIPNRTAPVPVVIARDISAFVPTYNASAFTINLVAEKNGKRTALQTRVLTLAE